LRISRWVFGHYLAKQESRSAQEENFDVGDTSC
jgi:hypothetical protein